LRSNSPIVGERINPTKDSQRVVLNPEAVSKCASAADKRMLNDRTQWLMLIAALAQPSIRE
jgi:hypothetical protein